MRQSNWRLPFLYLAAGACAAACRGGAKHEADRGFGGPSANGQAVSNVAPAAMDDGVEGDAGVPGPHPAGAGSRVVKPSFAGTGGDVPRADGGVENHFTDCSEGFAPSPWHEVDLTRLGLLCGPSNGMVERPERFTGIIDETGTEGRHGFRARRGECFRVIGAAEAPVDDLEIEIRGAGGDRRTLTNLDARWVVAPENEPLCPKRAGAHEIIVRTHGGRGRYALRLWSFP